MGGAHVDKCCPAGNPFTPQSGVPDAFRRRALRGRRKYKEAIMHIKRTGSFTVTTNDGKVVKFDNLDADYDCWTAAYGGVRTT